MTVTTGIAIYGAVLSTIGVGWNFYNEWKEKRKAAHAANAELLDHKRKLFELMGTIPFIDSDLPLLGAAAASPMMARYSPTESERMGRSLELVKGRLISLMDLPEARQLYNFKFPVASPGDTNLETALASSYENGFLPLQAIYRKLKRDLTAP